MMRRTTDPIDGLLCKAVEQLNGGAVSQVCNALNEKPISKTINNMKIIETVKENNAQRYRVTHQSKELHPLAADSKETLYQETIPQCLPNIQHTRSKP